MSNVPALLSHMKYVYIKNKVIADDGTDDIEIVDITSSNTNEEMVDPEELEKSLLETTDEFLHHEPLTNSTPKTHRVRLSSPSKEAIQPQYFELFGNEPIDGNLKPDANKSNEPADNQLTTNVSKQTNNVLESDTRVPEPFDNDAEHTK